MKYCPIDQLPEEYKSTNRMFVVIGIGVTMGGIHNYNTDPYCVWLNEDGTFARWPHDFEPTHFMELPAIGVKQGSLVTINNEVTNDELCSLCISPYNRGYEFIVTKTYNDYTTGVKYNHWAIIKSSKNRAFILHIPIAWVESVYKGKIK